MMNHRVQQPQRQRAATASSDSTTSSTLSCPFGTTTATDCRVGCSLAYSTVDNSIASTTMCYTTTCLQIVGCNPQGTTSTSISSSAPPDAQCAFRAATPYDVYASYSAMGIDLPAWLAYPITHAFIPEDEATASEETTLTSSVDPDQIQSLVLSLIPSDPSSKEVNLVTAVQTNSAEPSSNPDQIRSLVLSLLPSEPSSKEANPITAVQSSPTEQASPSEDPSSNPDQIISLMLSLLPPVPVSNNPNAITAIQTNPAEPAATTQAIEFPVRCESICAVYDY